MKQKVMKACLGILWGMFTLTTFLLQSCDNGKEVTPAQGSGGSPFNPQLPISVKEISPTNGAAGQKVLIYGENFGNDPSLIEVTIGGQKRLWSTYNQLSYIVLYQRRLIRVKSR